MPARAPAHARGTAAPSNAAGAETLGRAPRRRRLDRCGGRHRDAADRRLPDRGMDPGAGHPHRPTDQAQRRYQGRRSQPARRHPGLHHRAALRPGQRLCAEMVCRYRHAGEARPAPGRTRHARPGGPGAAGSRQSDQRPGGAAVGGRHRQALGCAVRARRGFEPGQGDQGRRSRRQECGGGSGPRQSL